MEQVHHYTTTLNWEEGRIGELGAPTLPEIKVATPPEFPKGVPNTWSPEHLFVAASNTCLMTTFLAIAENSKLEFKEYSCEAEGKLERIEKRFMISEIVLKPKIVLSQEKDIERAKRIIHKAEEHCLISNSMKTKIILEPDIKVK